MTHQRVESRKLPRGRQAAIGPASEAPPEQRDKKDKNGENLETTHDHEGGEQEVRRAAELLKKQMEDHFNGLDE